MELADQRFVVLIESAERSDGFLLLLNGLDQGSNKGGVRQGLGAIGRVRANSLGENGNEGFCHKLATSPKGPKRRMADLCGFRRADILWQK